MENFYNPDWWHKWSRKDLKKKGRLLNKTVREIDKKTNDTKKSNDS